VACASDDKATDHESGGETGAGGAAAGGNATGGNRNLGGNSSGGALGANGGRSATGGDGDTGVAGAPDNPPPEGAPEPVSLGTAGDYVILAKSAISNVPTSKVTGDLGLSPAAASYITGFVLTKAGTKWTSPEVVGNLFAADNDAPTPSALTTAVADMQTAYVDAAGRPTPAFLNLGAGAIGGRTLTPGLYKWTSAVTIPTDVTLDGEANDVWIFQIAGALTVSTARSVTLTGGAQPKNIVWQVAGGVTLGAMSHVEGVILCKTAIHLGTGASVNGRLLAQTAVDIAGATVTAP
jgi:hypothetical protein